MLKVGTDCSGIEAPLVALQALGVPYSHEWASEIDAACRSMILANHCPRILFEDMTARDDKRLPHIDLYVAGFPCQTFSKLRHMGNKSKNQDGPDARGNLYENCISVLRTRQPAAFLFENVPLLMRHAEYQDMLRALDRLGTYTISTAVLNAEDYGVPQSRKRLYIVGVKKGLGRFTFPECVPRVTLESFLKDKKIHALTKVPRILRLLPEGHRSTLYAVKHNGGETVMRDRCPCISTMGHVYLTKYNRDLSLAEMLALQGFPDDYKITVGRTQLRKQLGNAMNAAVLAHVFRKLLPAIGVRVPRATGHRTARKPSRAR
jgi:DNA (cytosine-5)-methyltransferase 1